MKEIIFQHISGEGEFVFRLFLACILGGIIGVERKNRNKGAGMRTHILVCLGSALIMLVSKYGFSDTVHADGSRIAAQVVSGIGFLGAGVIFVRNNAVSGLTTAAGIWVTSGIGLGIGGGQYVLSVIAAFFVITTQFLLHKINFLAKEPYRYGLKMEVVKTDHIMQDIENMLKIKRIQIVWLKIDKVKSDILKLDMEVIYPAGFDKNRLVAELIARKDIKNVRG